MNKIRYIFLAILGLLLVIFGVALLIHKFMNSSLPSDLFPVFWVLIQIVAPIAIGIFLMNISFNALEDDRNDFPKL